MAVPLFVKVRPYVVKRLGLEEVRFQTADGNYLLRQSDFLVFGPLYRLPEWAAQVGGVILPDALAGANQRGTANTPLPEPADPEWIDPEEDRSEDRGQSDEEVAAGHDRTGQSDEVIENSDEIAENRDEKEFDNADEGVEEEAEETEQDGEEVTDGVI